MRTSQPVESVQKVLWEACVRAHPYAEQLDATVAGGFDALTVPPHSALRNAENGLSPAQMRVMAEDRGVTLSHLDGGLGFMPITLPSDASERMIRRFGQPREQLLDLASELGIECVVTVGLFDEGIYQPDELVDGFGQLCDEVAQRGMDVTLEPLAFFGMQNFRLALETVQRAARPNARFMFDTWHFARTGADLSVLPDLASVGPLDIQINDGAAEPLGGSLLADSTEYRMFTGEGSFDVIGQLSAIGAENVGTFGPEIFSLALDQVPALEAARRCGESLRDTAKQVGIELG